MPNHIHLVAVPETASGLSIALRETHRRYSLRINRRFGWQGYLWQGRFFSFPMDDAHLLIAARYIELNPVRAGFVERPGDYLWSSAAANLGKAVDRLVPKPVLPLMIADWSRFIAEEEEISSLDVIHKHERTGRPLGGPGFLKEIERETGRILRKSKPGPRPINDTSASTIKEKSNVSL